MPHEILTPVFERNDERGTFAEVLNSGPWETFISCHMNPDSVLGNHYHKKTSIFLYILRGSARIKTVHVQTGSEDQFSLESGQGVILRPMESHSIRLLQESEFVMLKSHRYDQADPDTFHFPVKD